MTVSTPRMSSPRPARSVAMRKSASPSRKVSRACSRCSCVRLPCSSAARSCESPKRRRSRCAFAFDETKTMAREVKVRLASERRSASRSCSLPGLMRTNSCASRSATPYSASTLTCSGSRSDAFASSATSAEMVAEKRRVWRRRGSEERMCWRSSAKPSSSSRSASSITTKRSFATAGATFDERRWSAKRPGVATTMCGR
mmetsp:Transcript_10671/g.31232  ORF Transcript_10671/g.31232 Transcript_10671/m.31232 type:complete len:200 (+) Transcript_10671:188-787(+)